MHTSPKRYRTQRVGLLDVDAFRKVMKDEFRATSNQEIADVLKMDRTTIGRLLDRQIAPGDRFFTACIDIDVDTRRFVKAVPPESLPAAA